MWETAKNVAWAVTVVSGIISGTWTFVVEPALAGSMESKIKSQVTERFENIESNVGQLKLKSNDTHLTIKEVQIEQRAITREIDKTNVLLLQLLQQLRTAPITGQ